MKTLVMTVALCYSCTDYTAEDW